MSLIEHVRTRMEFSGLAYDPPKVLGIKTRIVGVFRWKEILSETAIKHGLTVGELLGQARSRWIAWPRFEAAHRLRKELGWSLPQIGRRLGDRDHTTALNALKRYEEPAVQDWLRINAARVRSKAVTP
jgi:chromosomal replication initiation ATPase DnaA